MTDVARKASKKIEMDSLDKRILFERKFKSYEMCQSNLFGSDRNSYI